MADFTDSFIPNSSLVPLFESHSGRYPVMGRCTAWNGTTGTNTVTVNGATWTNLPSFAGAAIAAPCTVLLIPVGSSGYVIADRLRVP
jgi:hypothetical protein